MEGVDASVNFMAKKLIISVDEERYDEVLLEAQDIIKKIEPDCKIVM